MNKLKQIYTALALCLPLAGWAQLQEYHLEQKIQLRTNKAARVKEVTPLSLPFWDDFSFTTTNSPVNSLWIKGDSVLVSNGQGVNPPTINVATFDGLTSAGMPYSPSPTDVLDFGYRDTLESQPIKMTEVTLPFRNIIYLSFFYQWKGNGEPPDANDFLRVEFKNSSGTWDEITTLRVQPDHNEETFYPYTFQINQDKYYHDEFRFRFVSYGRKSGRYDAWHIDYVYLNVRTENELVNNSINDRSQTIPFTSIAGDYYFSVPYKHFKESHFENFSKPFFEVYNLKDTTAEQPINYTTYFTITNFTDGIVDTTFNNFLEIQVGPVDPVPSLTRKKFQINSLPDTSSFLPDADSVLVFTKIGANGGDNTADYRSWYDPIDFRNNDTLTHVFRFADYYAYDDGVAEYSAGVSQTGNQLAYRFDMQTDSTETINGVFIHYPLFAGISPTTMQLMIMENNEGQPGAVLYKRTVPVSRTTNNEFITLDFGEIDTLIAVPVKGSFFVGYTQPVSGSVRIGLDKSHDTGDRIFYRSNSSITEWTQNDQRIIGSLMIRPRFGPGKLVTGLSEEQQPAVSFYPNPNKGEFYIEGKATVLGIISLTGQAIAFSSEGQGDQKRIILSNPSPGLYFVKYKNGPSVSTAKILIQN